MSKRTKPYLIRASFRPDAQIDYDAYPFSIPAVPQGLASRPIDTRALSTTMTHPGEIPCP